MTRRIDYLIEKYHFTEINESPRIASQWKEVLAECQQENASVEERLRIALLNVDYVTSFELPFRLLLTRTPQLIDKLRKEFALTQKNVLINDKRRGQVYSINADLSRMDCSGWGSSVLPPIFSDSARQACRFWRQMSRCSIH